MKPTSPASIDENSKRRFSRVKRGEDLGQLGSRKPRQRPRLAVTVREGLDLQIDTPIHTEGAWAIEPSPVEPADQTPLLDIDFTQPWEVSHAARDVDATQVESTSATTGVWEVVEATVATEEGDDTDTTGEPPDEEPAATVEWVDSEEPSPTPVAATSPVRRRTKLSGAASNPVETTVDDESEAADVPHEASVPSQNAELDSGRREIDLAISRAQVEAERADAARAEAHAAREEAEKLKKQARIARVQAQQIKIVKAEADAARAEAERLRSEAEAARRELGLLRSQSQKDEDEKAAEDAERLRDEAAAAQRHADQAGQALNEAAAAKAEAELLRAEADAAREQAAEAKRVAARVVKAAKAEAAKARALALAEAKAAAQTARTEAARARAAAEEERASAVQAKAEAELAKAEADRALAAAEAVVAQAARAAVTGELIDQPTRSRRRRGRVSSRPRLAGGTPVELTQIDTSRFEPIASASNHSVEPEWPSIGEADVAHVATEPDQPPVAQDDSEPKRTATYRASRGPTMTVQPNDRFRPYQAAFRPDAPSEAAEAEQPEQRAQSVSSR